MIPEFEAPAGEQAQAGEIRRGNQDTRKSTGGIRGIRYQERSKNKRLLSLAF